MLYEEGDAVGD